MREPPLADGSIRLQEAHPTSVALWISRGGQRVSDEDGCSISQVNHVYPPGGPVERLLEPVAPADPVVLDRSGIFSGIIEAIIRDIEEVGLRVEDLIRFVRILRVPIRVTVDVALCA
jgi:hypothetical protein